MGLPALRSYCVGAGLEFGVEQEEAFLRYREVLYRANAVSNVTRVPFEECELRHFVDSMLVAEFCPRGARVLDLGSGPGLPAWPLARMRPDLQVSALDSSGKMLRVLRECVLPNLAVKQQRAEDVNERERYEVVTGRAVAPLAVQGELSAPWLRVGGAFVPFRTPNDEAAIKKKSFARFGLKLERVERRTLPGSDVVRVFPVYRKVKATPRKYPRTWAEIKASSC